MKTLGNKNGPVAAMEIIDQEAGDVIGQHFSGLWLRNVQVFNAQRHLNMEKGQANHLIETTEMCKMKKSFRMLCSSYT